jgi:hypothetical protein
MWFMVDGATYVETEATRKSEFDRHAFSGGPTTTQLLREHGWWFTCRLCGDTITTETHPLAIVGNENHHQPKVTCGPKCRGMTTA